MLGGLGANSKGKVYNRDNAIARGRQNIENIRKKEQMIDIDKRDAVEKSASGKDTGATFEQMMVREQQLNTEKLINSINNLPDRMKVADAMDKTNEMMDTVGEKLASGMASLIETIKNIPFIGKYIRKVLDR